MTSAVNKDDRQDSKAWDLKLVILNESAKPAPVPEFDLSDVKELEKIAEANEILAKKLAVKPDQINVASDQ